MPWRGGLLRLRNFSAVAKNSLGGFCVLFRCRMNLDIIPTYVLRQGAPSCTGLYVEIRYGPAQLFKPHRRFFFVRRN